MYSSCGPQELGVKQALFFCDQRTRLNELYDLIYSTNIISSLCVNFLVVIMESKAIAAAVGANRSLQQ
jgi:hypothetical protein